MWKCNLQLLSCPGPLSLPLPPFCWWCCSSWNWGFCPVCPLWSAGWCKRLQRGNFSQLCVALRSARQLLSSCEFSRGGDDPKPSHPWGNSTRCDSHLRPSSFGFFRTGDSPLLRRSLMFWSQRRPQGRLYWPSAGSPARTPSGSCRHHSSDLWGTPWTTLPLSVKWETVKFCAWSTFQHHEGPQRRTFINHSLSNKRLPLLYSSRECVDR